MDQVCFNRTRFNTFMILIVSVSCYFFVIYTSYFNKENMATTDLYTGLSHDELVHKLKTCRSQLFDADRKHEECQTSLGSTKLELTRKQPFSVQAGPGRTYNNESEYQQIGIVYNAVSRFPLYGRRKYSRRSDKWEYYLIDETRNRLKIPYKSRNDDEIYNGDVITIPMLSEVQFTVQLYEYDTYKYNPL